MGLSNELQREIEVHLERLEELFKPEVRLSFIARLPENNEADILLTRDDPKEVIKLIERRISR